MSDGEFRMFAELVRGHCGLHFGPETRFLLERRVERRMRELSVPSFAAYHLELRSAPAGGGELGRLIDEITTNETYFFRERRQLLRAGRRDPARGDAAAARARRRTGDGVVGRLRQRRGALQHRDPGDGGGPRPGGQPARLRRDISRRMLQRARQGTYRESAFRETEAAAARALLRREGRRSGASRTRSRSTSTSCT